MININILGTNYSIHERTAKEDEYLETCDGYCDHTVKEIVCAKFIPGQGSLKDLDDYRRKVLRHELLHAFLFESGLGSNSDWATNEEMIDYFAYQIPKIAKAMQELNIL